MTMSRFKRPAVLAGLCLSVLSLFVLTRSDHGHVSSRGFGAERARRLLRGEGWGELTAGSGGSALLSTTFRRRASSPRAPPGHPYFTDDEDAMFEAAAAEREEEEHGGGRSSHHGHYWHKPLHPIDGWDVTGVGLACIGLMIAAAGGIGGGGILVPLFILVLGFDPKHAIPLSNITIFGGAITNTVLNLSKRHPDADRPLVDWDLILVMEPLTSKIFRPSAADALAALHANCSCRGSSGMSECQAATYVLYTYLVIVPKVTPHSCASAGT